MDSMKMDGQSDDVISKLPFEAKAHIADKVQSHEAPATDSNESLLTGQKGDLPDLVAENVSAIDAILIKRAIPIHSRPLQAALLFVEMSIIEVEDPNDVDPMADFAAKQWFAEIYQMVERWYLDKYGAELLRAPTRYLLGAFLFRGDVFELQIPIVRNEPHNGQTVWMVFPIVVGKNEDPLTWLPRPLPLQRLSPQELSGLRESLGVLVELLRSANNSLIMTNCPPELDEWRGSIRRHQLAAAQSLVAREFSAAMWECHQSVEWSLKLFIKLHGGSHPYTHDLDKLLLIAEGFNAKLAIASDFALLPSGKDAISYRCRERPSPSPESASNVYLASLRVVKALAFAMPKRMRMNEARFLLRRPPWTEPMT